MSKKKSISLDSVKNSIIQVVKKNKIGLNIKQISWAINLKGSKYVRKINRALKELKNENLIVESDDYKYQYKNSNKLVSGVIDINKSGNGYVKTSLYQEDILIKRKNTFNSLHKDTVSVKLIFNKKKLEGVVTNVLMRASTKFIGYLQKEKTNYFFTPDNSKISDFFIPKEKLKNAKNGDRVMIELTDWPHSAGCPFGKVIKKLNSDINLKSEINNTIDIFNIRNNFSQKIQTEINKLNSLISDKEIAKRKDFRKDITFTIDPEDAKDFDDAISIKFLKNKITQVGIHIADVSHYVKHNSEIDKEACLRAFSIYFPGRVIPMLPEELSNEICSLKPKQDKLTFSVLIDFKENNIQSVWVGKTIIQSNNRFTYAEVENTINKKIGLYTKEIIELNNIASFLKITRIKSGSINFNRNDIKFKLNDDLEPESVMQTPTLKSQSLVEEFMLLANKIVANKLSKQKSIYRVHDLPDSAKIKDLAFYLKNQKMQKTNISNKNLSLFINEIISKEHKNLNQSIIENLILRAMAKAKYSTKNIGHYGLGFSAYTHFTSPIRRYSDLIVHRLLDSHINKKTSNLLDLEKKCTYFSSVERTYIDVERKLNRFVQLKLLEKNISQTFKGYISGITNWGIYVELEGGQGEGLVSTNSIMNDKFYYNDSKHTLTGRKSGKKFTLGQEVVVQIKSINLTKIQMDLELI